jgi:hypothetical protein
MSTPLECPACGRPSKDDTYPGVMYFDVVDDEARDERVARLYVCPCGQTICMVGPTDLDRWRWFRYDPLGFQPGLQPEAHGVRRSP